MVPRDRGEELARSQDIPFLETSAKTNHNIDEVRARLNLRFPIEMDTSSYIYFLSLQAFEQLAKLILKKVLYVDTYCGTNLMKYIYVYYV